MAPGRLTRRIGGDKTAYGWCGVYRRWPKVRSIGATGGISKFQATAPINLLPEIIDNDPNNHL
jgi:hypothetical protein